LFLGWRSPQILTSRTRLSAYVFWQMVVFLLNGVVFVLIGLQMRGILERLSGQSVATLFTQGALLSAAVVVLRIFWVFAAAYLPRLLVPSFRRRDPYPSWRNVAVVAWTGMRGVVSLAAALSIPLTLLDGSLFPGRDFILFISFCIIFVTLVLQGLSLPALIRALGVVDDRGAEMEERTARTKANEAALAYLNELEGSPDFPPELLDRLRAGYHDRLRQLEVCGQSSVHGEGRSAPLYERLEQAALSVERRTIIQLRDEYVINDQVLRRIQRDLDLAEARLRGYQQEE
jgi:monovalent cation/hydrogen antiporter